MVTFVLLRTVFSSSHLARGFYVLKSCLCSYPRLSLGEATQMFPMVPNVLQRMVRSSPLVALGKKKNNAFCGF